MNLAQAHLVQNVSSTCPLPVVGLATSQPVQDLQPDHSLRQGSVWVERDRLLLQMLSSLGVMAIALLWNATALAPSVLAQSALPQQSFRLTQAMPPTASNLLFVNSTVGSDASGNGNQGTPFRTITQALRVAASNTVIMLAAGTYSAESGETFPLALRSGITLQGDPSTKGQGILIRGGGTYLSRTSAAQNVAILGANQAGLTGVTVTNPNPRGYGLWIESSSPIVANNTFSSNSHDGVSVVGNSAPVIRGNSFIQNGANGITIFGTSQPEVRENLFERTGFGINIAEQAAPRLLNNRIVQNRTGIVLQEQSRPILRGNTIEQNQEDGLVAIAQSQPDLGTAAEPGNNIFRNNGRNDINATATSQVISAIGNQLASPVTGHLNLGNGVLNHRSATVAVVPPAATRTIPPRLNAPTTANQPIAQLPAPPLDSVSTSRRSAIAPTSGSNSGNSTATSQTQQGLAALPQLEPAPIIVTPPLPPIRNSPEQFATIQPAPPETTTSSPGWSLAPRRPVLPQPVPSQSVSPQAPLPQTPSTGEAIEIPVVPPSPVSSPRLIRLPSPSSSATPIEIPVPPPTMASSGLPTSRPAAPLREVTVQRASSAAPIATGVAPGVTPGATGAIEIPVPPPSRPSLISRLNSLPSTAIAPRTTSPVPSTNLLPVPTGDVPLGNIGDLPTINVPSNPLNRVATLPPPTDSRRAVALGLRYRVVVEATTDSEQNQVRSLVSGAFRTSVNGRVVMQAGAYSDRANATEAANLLNSNGLRAVVQAIE
jgi:parallel beta-helix repeat protein